MIGNVNNDSIDHTECFISIFGRYGSIIIQTVLYACFLIGIIVFLIIDTANSRERLRSGLGIVILLAIGYIFSKHPGRVSKSHVRYYKITI